MIGIVFGAQPKPSTIIQMINDHLRYILADIHKTIILIAFSLVLFKKILSDIQECLDSQSYV